MRRDASIWAPAPGTYTAGIQISTNTAQGQDNAETSIYLDYYDKTEFEENFSPAVSDITGSYPSQENEIMLSKAALDALNIKDPTVSMEIGLNDDGEAKNFILSVWFTEYTSGAGGFQGFVSKAYSDSLGMTVEKNGVLSMSAKAGSQADLLSELNESVSLKNDEQLKSSYDSLSCKKYGPVPRTSDPGYPGVRTDARAGKPADSLLADHRRPRGRADQHGLPGAEQGGVGVAAKGKFAGGALPSAPGNRVRGIPV